MTRRSRTIVALAFLSTVVLAALLELRTDLVEARVHETIIAQVIKVELPTLSSIKVDSAEVRRALNDMCKYCDTSPAHDSSTPVEAQLAARRIIASMKLRKAYG